MKQQDDDIVSSGSDSYASEEIRADLIAVEMKTSWLWNRCTSLASLHSIIYPFISPELSDSSSESEFASDSERQHDSDNATKIPDDYEDPLPTGRQSMNSLNMTLSYLIYNQWDQTKYLKRLEKLST